MLIFRPYLKAFMKFTPLNLPQDPQNKLLQKKITFFEALLAQLETNELPTQIIESINTQLNEINELSATEKQVLAKMRKAQMTILRLLEKELKLVCQNHYRNTWLAVGMAVFGVPFGVIFGTSLGNMAFIGIGLPIGMVIGIAVGTQMDTKAKTEGRQLAIDL